MKKAKIAFLVCAFLVASANAQWFNTRIKGNQKMSTETRQVGVYESIGVGGSFDVKLISGKEGKLIVKAEENLLPYLITEVEGNTLQIKWKNGFNISHRLRVLIEVPVEHISKLALAGSGDIFTDHLTLTETALKISLAGSGAIKIAVKAEDLSAAISGSGTIDINGVTDKFEASLAGSGDVDAYDLVAKDANFKISGSGGIKANVSEMLNVSIAGSGDVYYKGNPKQDIKISGSGSVQPKA